MTIFVSAGSLETDPAHPHKVNYEDASASPAPRKMNTIFHIEERERERGNMLSKRVYVDAKGS